MKKIVFATAALAVLLSMGSCAKKADTDADAAARETAETTAAYADLTGTWQIEEIKAMDGTAIKPAEIDSITSSRMQFRPDSTFGVVTNCNSMGGMYIITGDSVRFDNMYSTRMACPDMSIEETLGSVLPQVKTVAFEHADKATLRTDGAGMVELTKIEEVVDTVAQ